MYRQAKQSGMNLISHYTKTSYSSSVRRIVGGSFHHLRSRSSHTVSIAPISLLPSARGLNNDLISISRKINLQKNRNTNISKRTFAEGGGGDGGGGSKSTGQDATTNEIVLTPGQKVAAGTQLTLWFGAFAAACCCAYYIGKELFPSKMSPNSVFNKSVEVIRQNDQVARRFGAPLKFYGRDHGGHREGRRNFIEHTEYTDKTDGSKRTRVRYNLEGQHGNAFVFAEVSNDMPSGEFVYVMVQDKRNGRVITVVDNRSAMLAKQMAGGKKEGQEAFANLLGGSKS